MGSEQSQQNIGSTSSSTSTTTNTTNVHNRSKSASGTITTSRLQRGNTIAITGQSTPQDIQQYEQQYQQQNIPSNSSAARPVSPPISVCSDSDLPYISYTDKPIGDSPKLRNKSQLTRNPLKLNNSMGSSSTVLSSGASSSSTTGGGGGSTAAATVKGRTNKGNVTPAHNIIVVRGATKIPGINKDSDIQKLQNIPQFLPVMRGTLSLPANRDPEVLERLQPIHLNNLAHRVQVHFNACAIKVSAEQQQIIIKIKEVDYDVGKLTNLVIDRNKLYKQYAEQFTKIHTISQQLSRCNSLLNQNIEMMNTLNNILNVNDRLEPFVWKTS